jgi:hypothetical protein
MVPKSKWDILVVWLKLITMNRNNLLKPTLRDVFYSEQKFREKPGLKYLAKSTTCNTFPSQALFLPKFVSPIMRPVYVKKYTSTK